MASDRSQSPIPSSSTDHDPVDPAGDTADTVDGWTTCVDQTTGDTYYWNTISNEVTWTNPYAAADDSTHDDSETTTTTTAPRAALPGSVPSALHHHHPADELDAIHPSRRAFFADPSHPSSTSSSSVPHASATTSTTHYNATAASHLDLLLHSIDRAKAGDTQSLVDTVSSEKSLTSAMASTVSSIRPTAVSSSTGHLLAASGVGDLDGGALAHAVTQPSAKSLNNLYFDEQAYQDQRNMEKALEAVYGKEKRKRLTKSELDKFKTKKEQQKKKKYLSKFENM